MSDIEYNPKPTQCRRCGSTAVAWVKSRKTGNWYLAYAAPNPMRRSTRGRITLLNGDIIVPDRPHKCDDPHSGGYETGNKKAEEG